MAKTVVGLFETMDDAQSAMQALQNEGISSDNASLIRTASSGLDATFGQLSIPQHDAEIYRQGVSNGGALIVLQALGDDEAHRAAEILDRYHVVDIDNMGGQHSGQSRSKTTTSTTRTGTSSADMGTTRGSTDRRNFYEGGNMVIPIIEEDINVGKREVEGGGVRVQTRVEERPVNEQVTLRDETVTVERRQIDQRVDPSDIDRLAKEGSIEVREHDEQAVVSKEARVVEEIVINKEAQERTETIQDTVRRTDVDVEEVQGQTRTSGFRETGSATTRQGSGSTDEGALERGASKLGNAVERGTGMDLDRDGDTGQRDPRNNV